MELDARHGIRGQEPPQIGGPFRRRAKHLMTQRVPHSIYLGEHALVSGLHGWGREKHAPHDRRVT